MTMTDHVLLIGEIKGRLDHIKRDQDLLLSKIDAIDERLRGVEQRSVLSGAVSGGIVATVVAVGTALIKSSLLGSGAA